MERNIDWKGLEQQSKRWHDYEKALRGFRRSLQRDLCNVHAIFERAEDYELGFRLRLENEFFVDAETLEPKEGFKRLATPRRKKDLALSTNSHEFFSEVLEVRKWFRGALRRRVPRAAHLFPGKYPVPGEELLVATAARKILRLFEDRAADFALIAETVEDKRLKTWAWERAATWLDTQISPDKNLRLRNALLERVKVTGLSLRQQKLLELVETGTTVLAFSVRRDDQPLRNVVRNEAARLMEETGTEQARKPERFETGLRQDPPEVGAEDKDLPEKENKEYERQYNEEKVEHAGLALQERRIAEIMVKHEDRTGEQISVKETVARYKALTGEGLAEGSVKSVRSRLRNKLGPVLGRT